MKRINFNIVLIVLFISFTACSTTRGTKGKITGTWYFKESVGKGRTEKWIVNQEEVKNNRGVRKMVFNDDNTFVMTRSGKTDKTITTKGVWKFNKDRRAILIEYTIKGVVKKETIRIVTSTKEILQIKR